MNDANDLFPTGEHRHRKTMVLEPTPLERGRRILLGLWNSFAEQTARNTRAARNLSLIDNPIERRALEVDIQLASANDGEALSVFAGQFRRFNERCLEAGRTDLMFQLAEQPTVVTGSVTGPIGRSKKKMRKRLRKLDRQWSGR
jgi:hypothetical protein